jgi:hypothetical protein
MLLQEAHKARNRRNLKRPHKLIIELAYRQTGLRMPMDDCKSKLENRNSKILQSVVKSFFRPHQPHCHPSRQASIAWPPYECMFSPTTEYAMILSGKKISTG